MRRDRISAPMLIVEDRIMFVFTPIDSRYTITGPPFDEKLARLVPARPGDPVMALAAPVGLSPRIQAGNQIWGRQAGDWSHLSCSTPFLL